MTKKITLKDIKKFVKDNCIYDVKITLDDIYPYGAWANSDFDADARTLRNVRIRINRKFWRNLYRDDPYRVKRLMLHEIGHFESLDPKKWNGECRTIGKRELDAQLWSIRKARQIGVKKLIKECIDDFKKWETYDWNSGHRRYRLGWNLFKKGKYPRKMYLEP